MNACSALKTIVPDQVCAFVGTGAYVEIPPDCTLFEGEPVTYTNLLAVLNKSDAEGGGSIPPGYTKLEYIESSGTQYIYFETGKTWERTWGYKVSCALTSPGATSQVFLSNLPGNNVGVNIGYNPYVTPKSIACGGYASTLNVAFEESKRYDCELNFFNNSELKINAERKTWQPAWVLYAELWDVVLMGWYNHREDGTPYCSPAKGQMKLFNFAITIENDLFFDMVPVLDASGTPCMFDKIRRKCFYNSGTGSFIVGMTMRQLPALLHLPRVTSGELTLSLPWEAQLVQYGAPAILEEVKNRGWTLIVQYAEPDPESAVYNKYAACKTVADIAAVNPDYTRDLTRDGGWIYPLPDLLNAQYLFQYTTLQYIQCDAPLCTNAHGAVVYSENLESFSGDWSNATDARWMFAGRKVNKLRDVNAVFPALEKGSNMFHLCILNKESVIRVANSLPTWTSGTHNICFGIHIDHQNDEEVLAALEAVEAKGWTLTVQWNGTATVAAAATYGLRKPPIYAKIGTIEYPDGTTEKTLDWGHYVTNWEENGYTEFASLEEAYSHFNLTMPE